MFIYKVAAGRTWQRSLKAGSARVPMNYWYSSCLNVCESGNSPGAHYKHPRQTKSQNLTPTFPLKCGPVQHEERITTGYEKSTSILFCLTRGRLQKWKTAQQGKQKSTTIKRKTNMSSGFCKKWVLTSFLAFPLRLLCCQTEMHFCNEQIKRGKLLFNVKKKKKNKNK